MAMLEDQVQDTAVPSIAVQPQGDRTQSLLSRRPKSCVGFPALRRCTRPPEKLPQLNVLE